MRSAATTVAGYLASLPPDRRAAVSALRDVIRANLDDDYEEGIQYGMLGYYVPHRVFPAGYHTDPKQPLPFAAIAAQKNYLALYLMSLSTGPSAGRSGETADTRWFREAFRKAGKKLDMGKSCVRWKTLDDLPLDVIGEAIRRIPARTFVARYQAARGGPSSTPKRATTKKAATKKAVTKKAATKKPAAKTRR